jgi:selenocysteine lyase/cysteine desulfurase
MTDPIMLSCQRHLFDLGDDVAYINCAYFGPFMREAVAAGEQGMARRIRPWTIARDDFYAEAETLRGLFAQLIGATADDIAITPSSSYAAAVAAANVELASGKTVLVPSHEHPSNFYAWHDLAERRGSRVISVERPADGDWTRAVLARIDSRTGIVAMPPCHWSDGSVIDVVAIGEAARGVGAAFVVDGTQVIGAQPFDVTRVKPDFLICSAYKWLFSPYTLAFLYAAPHRQSGRPIELHSFNRQGARAIQNPWEHIFPFENGARRYDMGERSNFTTLPMATAALRQILSWTIAGIDATTRALSDAIEKEAAALGLGAPRHDKRIANIIGLIHPKAWPEDIAHRLMARGVSVSLRGDRLRVSPHVYNDLRDVGRLIEGLRATLR